MTHNRKFLLGLLVSGFLFSCTSESPNHILEEVKNGTVKVSVESGTNGNMGEGSGFFITHDRIVTNIHVVAGEQKITVIGRDKQREYDVEGVIDFDPEYDIVVLKVSGSGNPLKLYKRQAEIKDSIYAAGYPGGKHRFEIKEGSIYNIWNEGKQLKLLAPLIPGNSGGPIVNLRGEVVGVAVGVYANVDEVDITPVFGYAASASVLEELLQKSKSAKPLSLPDWQNKPCVRAYVSDMHGQDKMLKAESTEKTADKEQLYGEAVKHFERARELCPNHATFHYALGAAKFFLDEFKAAIDVFAEVIALIPDHDEAHRYIGRAWYELGKETNGKEAENYYNEAIRAFDKTIILANVDATDIQKIATAKHVAELLCPYRHRVQVKIALGGLKVKQGNVEEAQRLYGEILDDWTETVKLDRDTTNNYLKFDLTTAYCYYIKGGIEFILGQSQASQRNAEEALEHYRKAFDYYRDAFKLNSNDAEPYVYYSKAIELLNHDSAETYFIRGAMKAMLGKFKADGDVSQAQFHYHAAIEDLKKSIELKLDNVYVYSNLGYTKYLLGKIETELGNEVGAQKLYKKAIDYCEKAIQRDQNNAYPYNVRGSVKTALEDYDGAIADHKRAIELRPDFAEAYWELGLARQKIGQQKEADADFKKAKEFDPDVGK